MNSLSPEHVKCAAVNPYVLLEVYIKTKDMVAVKKSVTVGTPDGTFVALYA